MNEDTHNNRGGIASSMIGLVVSYFLVGGSMTHLSKVIG